MTEEIISCWSEDLKVNKQLTIIHYDKDINISSCKCTKIGNSENAVKSSWTQGDKPFDLSFSTGENTFPVGLKDEEKRYNVYQNNVARICKRSIEVNDLSNNNNNKTSVSHTNGIAHPYENLLKILTKPTINNSKHKHSRSATVTNRNKTNSAFFDITRQVIGQHKCKEVGELFQCFDQSPNQEFAFLSSDSTQTWLAQQFHQREGQLYDNNTRSFWSPVDEAFVSREQNSYKKCLQLNNLDYCKQPDQDYVDMPFFYNIRKSRSTEAHSCVTTKETSASNSTKFSSLPVDKSFVHCVNFKQHNLNFTPDRTYNRIHPVKHHGQCHLLAESGVMRFKKNVRGFDYNTQPICWSIPPRKFLRFERQRLHENVNLDILQTDQGFTASTISDNNSFDQNMPLTKNDDIVSKLYLTTPDRSCCKAISSKISFKSSIHKIRPQMRYFAGKIVVGRNGFQKDTRTAKSVLDGIMHLLSKKNDNLNDNESLIVDVESLLDSEDKTDSRTITTNQKSQLVLTTARAVVDLLIENAVLQYRKDFLK